MKKNCVLWVQTFLILSFLFFTFLTSMSAESLEAKTAKKDLSDFKFLVEQVYPSFAPRRNQKALEKYIQSRDFIRHKQSATVYFDDREMTELDAKTVLMNRDPVNIAMSTPYDLAALQEFLIHRFEPGSFLDVNNNQYPNGFKNSAYSRNLSLSNSTKHFGDKPYTVSVYSETFLWPHWDGSKKDKKEIAILSIPAPALDIISQPHFAYYVQDGILNQNRYQDEMNHLAKTIVQTIKNVQKTAFNGKGIKRVILSRYGQVNFLSGISVEQQKIAREIFAQTLSQHIKTAKNQKIISNDIQILISIYGGSPQEQIIQAGINAIKGDILKIAKPYDFILNSWDPHSFPGNGNDNDNSLDGFLGRATGIVLTQLPHFNPLLRYVGVHN